MDDCEPCGFGYTSPAGAESKEQCTRLPHKCPAGQIAPPDAVSEAECACRPGWGGKLLVAGVKLQREGC